MQGLKTIDLRVLVPENVDEDLFVEQLVRVTHGDGAPYGAVKVHLDVDDLYDVDIAPTGPVVTGYDVDGWFGQRVQATSSITTR